MIQVAIAKHKSMQAQPSAKFGVHVFIQLTRNDMNKDPNAPALNLTGPAAPPLHSHCAHGWTRPHVPPAASYGTAEISPWQSRGHSPVPSPLQPMGPET